MPKSKDQYTNGDSILLACAEAQAEGATEVHEAELTVQAWKRDKNRFGLPGFEQEYPNHKAAMRVVMDRKGSTNPLRRGLMIRTRPNHYAVTSSGFAEVERLLSREGRQVETRASEAKVYDEVLPYLESEAIKRYRSDPEQPKAWTYCAAFFGIQGYDAVALEDRITRARRVAADALECFERCESGQFRRGTRGGGRTIHRDEVERLIEFIDVMLARFADDINAIRGAS